MGATDIAELESDILWDGVVPEISIASRILLGCQCMMGAMSSALSHLMRWSDEYACLMMADFS